jgi:uncharacterized protein YodC (DUF2158 family)
MDFKVGEMVTMWVGGPAMTVVEIIDCRLRCAWKDQQGAAHEGLFNVEWLERRRRPRTDAAD